MSIDRNFGRTLSGATDIAIDNLRLGDNINSIRINGNAGLPNQVLAKNGTTGKLEWDFVESTTIPDGSITGNKLATDITISTTGNIDAETIRANTFICPKTGDTIISLTNNGIETFNTGDALKINNGGDIEFFSDAGGSQTLFLDGNTGSITMGSNSKIRSYGVSEIMGVNNGGEINLYDDNVGLSKTIGIVGETGSITSKTLLLNGKDGTTTAVITGNVDINVSPFQDGDLTVAGDYSSLNGDLTLTNGTITCDDLNVNNHTGIIELSSIRTSFIGLPKTGTLTFSLNSDSMNLNDYSVNGATSTATFKLLTLMGGSGVADSLLILGNTLTGTDSAGTDGSITIGTGDLNVNNGGKVDLFSDAGTTRTIDIDGATGDLKVYNPSNGTERIELDGTTGNIIMNAGGRIEMFSGNILNIELNGANGIIDCVDINVSNHTGTITFNNVNANNIDCTHLDSDRVKTDLIQLPRNGNSTIELNGSNGVIDCEDINVNNHTGTIDFNNVRCDNFNANTIIIPEDTSGGVDFSLNNNTMSFGADYTITGSSTGATLKTIALVGGVTVGTPTFTCIGKMTTGTDSNGNLGDIELLTGDLTATTGNITATAGDITAGGLLDITGNITSTTGNIIATAGDITATAGDITAGGTLEITGNTILRGGVDILGDNSVDIIDSSSTLQFRFTPSNGNFVAGTGDITATAGDITATAGDITASAGAFTSNKVGSKPVPEDNTYTDWALNLSTINSHAHIGGNLICDGTIYANVEGTITEEVVDCQRINIRTDPSGATGGDTKITFGSDNLTINDDGDIEYKDQTGIISGYFDTTGTGLSYSDYSTPMKHFRLDSTNYKNHLYEIGVNIPNQQYLERSISVTSTGWVDLNDELSIKLITDGASSNAFIVDFSFYAVITNGARLWLKLFDGDIQYLENFYQPSYFNDTMSQVLLDTNGANDFAGVHNVRFLVRGIPASVSKNIRVACWVITTSGHKVTFKSGARVLNSTSTNPSASFNKYPPMFLQSHKLLNFTNISTASPTGWSAPSEDDY